MKPKTIVLPTMRQYYWEFDLCCVQSSLQFWEESETPGATSHPVGFLLFGEVFEKVPSHFIWALEGFSCSAMFKW